MKRMTLVFDESGKFESRGRDQEHVANLVGGFAGQGDARETDGRIRPTVEKLRERLGGLHAKDMQEQARREVRATLGAKVRELASFWLFVVRPPSPSDASEVRFALHLRMVGAWVDLAARLCTGVEAIDVRPAQRTLSGFDRTEAQQLVQRGVAYDGGREDLSGLAMRGLVQADVRIAVEQVAREGGPRLGEIVVESADSPSSHAGLAAADAACFYVRTLLQQSACGNEAFASWPEFATAKPLVVAYDELPALRDVDRALRQPIPELGRAATTIARLEGNARAAAGRFALVEEGTARTARLMFDRAIGRLEKKGPGELARLAAHLASFARGVLDARTGAYEGLWSMLSATWAADAPLPSRVREAVRDRELRATLDRLTMECANHRGDVEAAERAHARFNQELSGARSIALLAESLTVRNLRVVNIQNRFLCTPEEAPHRRDELTRATSELAESVEEAAALVILAERITPAATALEAGRPREQALWDSLGATRVSERPDAGRGRCVGSLARSYAFLGDTARAIEHLLRARVLFGEDEADLRFNAAVLVRVLAEQGRLGHPNARATRAALELAEARGATQPTNIAEQVRKNPALRFTIDALLRVMLWVPDAVDGDERAAWQKLVGQGRHASLFEALARGELRSHPSELLARHAGELARGEARRDWLTLSIELSEEATDGTIRNLTPFTRALFEEHVQAEAPMGSVENPTFEYR